MDHHVYSPFIQFFPVDLVITRYPKILSVVPRILWAYCLAILCHLNTPTDNSRTYRVSAHSQLIQVLHKSVRNTIRSSENPQDPFCSWNSCLLALWLILSLVILLASLVIIILSPLINLLRMLAILNQSLEFILPAQTSFETWAGSRQSNCRRFCPYVYWTYPSLIRASVSDPSLCKS